VSHVDTHVFAPDIDQDGPVQLDRELLVWLAQCGLNETTFAVLLILLARHDRHTGKVKITQREIAEVARVGRQAVNSALKVLAAKKLVTRIERSRYVLAPVFYAAETVVSIAPSDIEAEFRATQLGSSSTRGKLRVVTD
jgi:hypothetical protein